jgi:hypothetical protein
LYKIYILRRVNLGLTDSFLLNLQMYVAKILHILAEYYQIVHLLLSKYEYYLGFFSNGDSNLPGDITSNTSTGPPETKQNDQIHVDIAQMYKRLCECKAKTVNLQFISIQKSEVVKLRPRKWFQPRAYPITSLITAT